MADDSDRYTPPLGLAVLTPLYDTAIRLLTREAVWRRRLVERIATRPGEMILDVGSGTGSLAVAVTARVPRCSYRGFDPDGAAVDLARRKAAAAGSTAVFAEGHFGAGGTDEKAFADTIVSSLVLHQVALAEKRRLLSSMFARLKPGGRIVLADYGEQRSWLMRLLFRATVQALDGRTDTQPNADGILPRLLQDAGFADIEETDRFATATGMIYIYRAERPPETQED
jgi:ubiquinone/menaquinone biosynthesis C-methylase UbiE